jgi:hypothetical protein
MTGISAAGALIASRFSNTIPSILRLKPVRPVLNVTNHSPLYCRYSIKITLNSIKFSKITL